MHPSILSFMGVFPAPREHFPAPPWCRWSPSSFLGFFFFPIWPLCLHPHIWPLKDTALEATRATVGRKFACLFPMRIFYCPCGKCLGQMQNRYKVPLPSCSSRPYFLMTLASSTHAASGEKYNLLSHDLMDSNSYAWFPIAQGQENPAA